MHRLSVLLAALLVTGLTGCAAVQQDATPALLDLGPRASAPAAASLSGLQINVADVRAPDWLDSRLIHYRLSYADAHRLRPYSRSRWTMSPRELLSQKVRQAIAEAGAIALTPSDGASRAPTLRIHLDDFSQYFPSPQVSKARLALRATVLDGRRVIGQRSFISESATPGDDAAAAARGLAEATQAALADLVAWLETLPLE